MKKVKQDLTGLVFGKLMVLHQVEDYIEPCGVHRDRWLCECSCESHTRIEILGNNLRKKNGTRSCGCIRGDSIKKYNTYTECEDYIVGITSNTNEEFYFDKSNYELIKQYYWHVHVYKDGYRRLEAKDRKTGKSISMAQLLGCQGYDHCNRNPLDNRMQNLRPASFAENARNSSVGRNNSSGIIGVGWSKCMNKWRSRITVNYNEIELGYFYDKNDAVVARLNAELKYFGPKFAPQRHLFEEYNIKIDEEVINDYCM